MQVIDRSSGPTHLAHDSTVSHEVSQTQTRSTTHTHSHCHEGQRKSEYPGDASCRELSTGKGTYVPWAARTLDDTAMAWVYILECADGKYYVGSTRDLDNRLRQHSSAQVGFTAHRQPVRLAWSVELSLDDAYAIERRIHGWSRAKKKALIDGDIELLRARAGRRGGRPR